MRIPSFGRATINSNPKTISNALGSAFDSKVERLERPRRLRLLSSRAGGVPTMMWAALVGAGATRLRSVSCSAHRVLRLK